MGGSGPLSNMRLQENQNGKKPPLSVTFCLCTTLLFYHVFSLLNIPVPQNFSIAFYSRLLNEFRKTCYTFCNNTLFYSYSILLFTWNTHYNLNCVHILPTYKLPELPCQLTKYCKTRKETMHDAKARNRDNTKNWCYGLMTTCFA